MDRINRLMEAMSLRDKLAQMMVFSPRTWKTGRKATWGKVPELNDEMRQYIADRHFGGILLFKNNFLDAEQTVKFTAELTTATAEETGIKPFIAVDQEGGDLTRISFATQGVGNMALAATGDSANARKMAAVYGEELSLLGIHVNFAPVIDINNNAANPVIGIRSFGDDAQAVSDFGVAYMEGMRDKGIIACAKHFPGHGNTDKDSHTSLPLVNSTLDELSANELIPFKAAIDAGIEMVMTAHIQYPQIEKQTYRSITTGKEISLPATMSRTILTDLLRGELGYDGLIVTDALGMRAIWDHFAQDDMLALCINAGVDLLLLPCSENTEIWSVSDDLLNRAVELAKSGVIDATRIDDAVRRILLLKQKHNLLDGNPDLTEERITAAIEGCGSAENRRLSWNMSAKALTLLRNKNDAFPIHMREDETVLILCTTGSCAGAGDVACHLMENMGALPRGVQIGSMVMEAGTMKDCVAAAQKADHVLIISRTLVADPAAGHGFPFGLVNEVISDLHSTGKTAIVISAQLPYDAACYPDADAILLSYGSGAIRSKDNGKGCDFSGMPNLPAAICSVLGAIQPSGKLPVNIPVWNEQYHPTKKMLYYRGRV